MMTPNMRSSFRNRIRTVTGAIAAASSGGRSLERLAAAFAAGVMVGLGVICGPAVAHAQVVVGHRPVVAGYLPYWSTNPDTIAALPADALTHILYAFGAVRQDGRVELGDRCKDIGICDGGSAWGGNFAALAELKKRHPHLKVLISLGGWTGSGHFSDAASTPETRETFVSSAIDLFLTQHGDVFDGIDIDWEYPVAGGLPENSRRPQDRDNFTRLLEETRRQLDRLAGPGDDRALLTIATTASPWYLGNIDVKSLAEIVDWIGIMTYDYGVGAPDPAFNAPLFPATPGDPRAASVASSVEAYLAAGAPPERLLIGLPFYGRVYGIETEQFLKEGSAAAEGGSAPYLHGSTIAYRALVASDLVSQGFRYNWHPLARVPWLDHPGGDIWISFDDRVSIRKKIAFARIRGLRGVMAWDLNSDNGDLITAVQQALTPPM